MNNKLDLNNIELPLTNPADGYFNQTEEEENPPTPEKKTRRKSKVVRNKKRTVHTSFLCTEDSHDALSAIASARSVTLNQILNELVEEYIRKNPNLVEQGKKIMEESELEESGDSTT